MHTGESIRDFDFMDGVYGSGRDVDRLTQEEFDVLVATKRAWIEKRHGR